MEMVLAYEVWNITEKCVWEMFNMYSYTVTLDFYSINNVIHGRFTVLQPVRKMYTSFCTPFQTCFCWTDSII